MKTRLSIPRVEPAPESEWSDEQRELLEGYQKPILGIFRTLVRHPKLLKRWRVFGSHVLYKQTLPARDREILILRIGWLCQAAYEWHAHMRIGRGVGLSDEDIERIEQGPEAPGLDAFEAVLLRAVDELRADAMLGDATWKALAERYDTRQMMDLIFTVGQYQLVSMALNSLGVQIADAEEAASE